MSSFTLPLKDKKKQAENEVLAWIDGKIDVSLLLTKKGLIAVKYWNALARLKTKGTVEFTGFGYRRPATVERQLKSRPLNK